MGRICLCIATAFFTLHLKSYCITRKVENNFRDSHLGFHDAFVHYRVDVSGSLPPAVNHRAKTGRHYLKTELQIDCPTLEAVLIPDDVNFDILLQTNARYI